ncbi:MAG: ribonuclease P protein component [Minisyncoccota bacterium]
MLKKELRLRKKEDFEKVFRKGKPFFFSEIGCRYLSGVSPLRVGFSLSKKFVPTAVQRNRLRRMLSEALTLSLQKNAQTGEIIFFILHKPKKINFLQSQQLVGKLFHIIQAIK